MRARVHDVIGQRLSILHRYLEEGRLDDESLEQIDPLLRSIAADLRSGGASEPAEQLGDIAHAFGLVSVQIDVEGALPEDARVAAAFCRLSVRPRPMPPSMRRRIGSTCICGRRGRMLAPSRA